MGAAPCEFQGAVFEFARSIRQSPRSSRTALRHGGPSALKPKGAAPNGGDHCDRFERIVRIGICEVTSTDMEPITQVLASVALARCGFKRVTPLALPITVTAGLAPDVDWVSVFGGARAFLEWHRTATHSIVGIVVIAAAIAAAYVLIAPRVGRIVRRKRAETSLPAGRQAPPLRT